MPEIVIKPSESGALRCGVDWTANRIIVSKDPTIVSGLVPLRYSIALCGAELVEAEQRASSAVPSPSVKLSFAKLSNGRSSAPVIGNDASMLNVPLYLSFELSAYRHGCTCLFCHADEPVPYKSLDDTMHRETLHTACRTKDTVIQSIQSGACRSCLW